MIPCSTRHPTRSEMKSRNGGNPGPPRPLAQFASEFQFEQKKYIYADHLRHSCYNLCLIISVTTSGLEATTRTHVHLLAEGGTQAEAILVA